MEAAGPQEGRAQPVGVDYGGEGALLVLADSDEAGARACRSIEASGLRVAAVVPVCGGERRIDHHAAAAGAITT